MLCWDIIWIILGMMDITDALWMQEFYSDIVGNKITLTFNNDKLWYLIPVRTLNQHHVRLNIIKHNKLIIGFTSEQYDSSPPPFPPKPITSSHVTATSFNCALIGRKRGIWTSERSLIGRQGTVKKTVPSCTRTRERASPLQSLLHTNWTSLHTSTTTTTSTSTTTTSTTTTTTTSTTTTTDINSVIIITDSNSSLLFLAVCNRNNHRGVNGTDPDYEVKQIVNERLILSYHREYEKCRWQTLLGSLHVSSRSTVTRTSETEAEDQEVSDKSRLDPPAPRFCLSDARLTDFPEVASVQSPLVCVLISSSSLFFFLSRWIHITRRRQQQQQPLSLLRAAGSSYSPAALRASSSSRRGALRAGERRRAESLHRLLLMICGRYTRLCPPHGGLMSAAPWWPCTVRECDGGRKQSAVGADMGGHAEALQRSGRDGAVTCRIHTLLRDLLRTDPGLSHNPALIPQIYRFQRDNTKWNHAMSAGSQGNTWTTHQQFMDL